MAFSENFCTEIWLLNFLDFRNENLTLGIPNNTACNVWLCSWTCPTPTLQRCLSQPALLPAKILVLWSEHWLIFPMLPGPVALKKCHPISTPVFTNRFILTFTFYTFYNHFLGITAILLSGTGVITNKVYKKENHYPTKHT